MVKDLLSSQLKAFGYKSLFTITLGPIVIMVSLPLYIVGYGSKFHNLALGLSTLGGKIIRGDMSIANWSFVFIDLLLFGEFIPIIEAEDFTMISLQNETATSVC